MAKHQHLCISVNLQILFLNKVILRLISVLSEASLCNFALATRDGKVPLPLNVIYFEIRFSQMKWSCSHTGVEWTLNPTELVSLPEEETTVKAQTHREKPVPCLQRQKLEWSTKSKKDQDSGWAPDARGGEGGPSLVRRRHSPANVLIPDVESLELWGKFLI